MGTTGLETAFAALYAGLVEPGHLRLELLLERLTDGAGLYGLPAPRIAAGESADLVLIDLGASWIAGEHGWASRSENCCFAGQRMLGRPLVTVSRGAVVHDLLREGVA